MCKSFVFFFLFSLSFLERIANENSFPLSSASAGIIIFLRKYETQCESGEKYIDFESAWRIYLEEGEMCRPG